MEASKDNIVRRREELKQIEQKKESVEKTLHKVSWLKTTVTLLASVLY